MSSQYSPASTLTHSSRSSSPEHDRQPPSPLRAPDEDFPDPSPPSSPRNSVIASPPLETQSYTPHALGIGILSPQPVLGRFAPVSRASLSPLQVRTSPVEQRSNPLECLSPRDRPQGNPFDHLHTLRSAAVRSPETTQAHPLPPPHLRYVGDASPKDGPAGEHVPLTNFSSASAAPAGLRIAIPPPNPSQSTSTPSPPLLPPPAHDPVANAAPSNADPAASAAVAGTAGPSSSDPQAPPEDVLAPTDINIDFTEFDAEGYSALEKIYLFSRSRAGFHRVFIAHALPRYLLGAENSTSDLPSQEQIEQITPSEAVDYVLPLLNILATDDDDAVKEALAAELVPIIWWFVTHCRLVEDDTTPQPPSPPAPTPLPQSESASTERESSLPPLPPLQLPADGLFRGQEAEEAASSSVSVQGEGEGEEARSAADQSESGSNNDNGPTVISVQAFTPLLGTLLLSPNGMVGGSARYAVVELLRRLRRADQREDDERASLSGSSDDMAVDGQESHSQSQSQSQAHNSQHRQSRDQQRMSSPTPSQALEEQDADEHADVGLFQRNERRLFEHELVYQVVIGMGRLDMDDGRADAQEDEFLAGADTDTETPGSGVSTAVPTPQAEAAGADSYFPATSTLGLAPGSTGTMAAGSSAAASPPAGESAGVAAPSPSLSPSPPASSGSSISDSPGYSSSSTPSLTSSTSSSSGGYSDTPDYAAPDRLSIDLGDLPKADDLAASAAAVPMVIDDVAGAGTGVGADARLPLPRSGPESWLQMPQMPPHPLARHAVLPTTPPFEVPPPPPPVAAPSPVNVTAEPVGVDGVPLLQVQVQPGAVASSPVAETAPRAATAGGAGFLSPRSAAATLELAAAGAVAGTGTVTEDSQDDGSEVNEEAAVGRLSSMSLMAAVTASGSISEEAKAAFVAEVERVGRDPIYWVRREASFAVGALAKVVPVEVVTSSLLPLFESLCHDPTWHVRHSVLFALPAILSRLSPDHRRRLALEVILPLSQDEEPTVRSAVLEALGEVMYTFAEDEGGPPDQLLKLFLGIRETEDPGGGDGRVVVKERSQSPETRIQPPPSAINSASATSSAWSDYGTDAGAGPDIYDDPQRPLVCAFNYPAVALTLGRDRWPELRPLYLTLAQSPAFKIRRTLAASLGEMAKIIGEEHARADLMDVWRSNLRSEESEVRMKVLDAVQTFVRAIGMPERTEVVRDLEEVFLNGKLSSWREREKAVKTLGGLVEVEGLDGEVLRRMLVKALDDRVAAVREAAVAAIPAFVRQWKDEPTLLEELRSDIRAFASSDTFRRRTTYVTCIQEMLAVDQGDVAVRRETFWSTLSQLGRDPIVDVRIRVARLLGLISDKFSREDSDIAAKAVALARDLASDASHEVRAFAAAVVAAAGASSAPGSAPNRPTPMTTIPPRIGKSAATFSRPPPPSPNS
ncbi:ARM repeat-containing protein [Trametes cingulata]|nr:ARM repeat-containing protein [Trametes cingulata]